MQPAKFGRPAHSPLYLHDCTLLPRREPREVLGVVKKVLQFL